MTVFTVLYWYRLEVRKTSGLFYTIFVCAAAVFLLPRAAGRCLRRDAARVLQ